MKRIITGILTLILCICFSFSAFAEVVGEDFVFGDGKLELEVYTQENIFSESGIVNGMTVTEFKEYLKTNNIVLCGSDEDNTLVFNLTVTQTPFSSKTIDFSGFSEAEIESFAPEITEDFEVCITVNGIKYIKAHYVEKTENTSYVITQYITVKNSRLYVLTVNIAGSESNAKGANNSQEIISRLKINDIKVSKISTSNIITLVLLSILIIIIAFVVIVITISFVRDYKAKKREQKL